MAKMFGPFEPDYAFPPGDTLLEVLEDRQLAVSTLATQTGLTEQDIISIVSGKLLVDAKIAAALEAALEISASFWLTKEQHYREFLAKDAARIARRRKTA